LENARAGEIPSLSHNRRRIDFVSFAREFSLPAEESPAEPTEA
jgi:hypothetical protein